MDQISQLLLDSLGHQRFAASRSWNFRSGPGQSPRWWPALESPGATGEGDPTGGSNGISVNGTKKQWGFSPISPMRGPSLGTGRSNLGSSSQKPPQHSLRFPDHFSYWSHLNSLFCPWVVTSGSSRKGIRPIHQCRSTGWFLFFLIPHPVFIAELKNGLSENGVQVDYAQFLNALSYIYNNIIYLLLLSSLKYNFPATQLISNGKSWLIYHMFWNTTHLGWFLTSCFEHVCHAKKQDLVGEL